LNLSQCSAAWKWSWRALWDVTFGTCYLRHEMCCQLLQSALSRVELKWQRIFETVLGYINLKQRMGLVFPIRELSEAS